MPNWDFNFSKGMIFFHSKNVLDVHFFWRNASSFDWFSTLFTTVGYLRLVVFNLKHQNDPFID